MSCQGCRVDAESPGALDEDMFKGPDLDCQSVPSELNDATFLSTEQKIGKPKHNLREDVNDSNAQDLQSHERHHSFIDIQQFPLRHDSLDIVSR